MNVIGYFRMAKACSAEMMKRSGGKIINLASIAGRRPQPGMGVYCVSKAGVLMHTEVLAAELADAGIQVNAIAPGFVKTAFSRAIWDNPELKQTVLKDHTAKEDRRNQRIDWNRPIPGVGCQQFHNRRNVSG